MRTAWKAGAAWSKGRGVDARAPRQFDRLCEMDAGRARDKNRAGDHLRVMRLRKRLRRRK